MVTGIMLKLLASSLCLLPQQALPGTPTHVNTAAAAPPAITWHAARAITIPFEYFRQHIYVTVTINGKPGFIFMLDSGANRNILNLRTARQLGIAPQSLTQAKDIGFGGGRIYVGPPENVNVEVDSMAVAHTMSVTDLNQFEEHFQHRTDGMLGYPFLRQFVVKVDFQRRLLTLLPPDRYRYRGLGIELPLRSSENFVVMPVTVGSDRYVQHQIELAVDTGSNVTLMLFERTVSPLKLRNSFLKAQPETAYGLNGYYSVACGSLDSLAIGDAETHNVAVDYLQDDDQVGPEPNLLGAIGNGILQSFQVVVFDVPHQRIFFELKPIPLQLGVERTATADP